MTLKLIVGTEHKEFNTIKKFSFWKFVYSKRDSHLDIQKMKKYGIGFSSVHAIIPLNIHTGLSTHLIRLQF